MSVCVSLVTVVAMLVAPAAAQPTPSSACDALRQKYDADNVPERVVSVAGRAHELRVYHDATSGARAAAALLAAGLRHRLRVRVALRPAPVLCRLAERLRLTPDEIDGYARNTEPFLALVPSAVWDSSAETCSALQHGGGAGAVPPRLRVQGRGAAPARLRLFARLAPHAESRPLCRPRARWSFYTNDTTLETCSFLLENGDAASENTRKYVTLFYPAESEKSAVRLAAYATRFGLRLRPRALGRDSVPREDLLALLRRGNHSFLFLDYETWTGFDNVYTVDLPPDETELDPKHTVRLADAWVLRQVAPDILNAFHRFEPTLNDLSRVLEIEAQRPDANVTEAACAAALEIPKFGYWFKPTVDRRYEVAAFLCRGDPDHEGYNYVLNVTKNLVNRSFEVTISTFEVDCGDEHSLMSSFIERAQSVHWARFAGALGVGAGAHAAAAAADALDAALVLYDVAAPRAASPAARLATARHDHLVRALQHFITKFGWTRLAVLYQDSHPAPTFVASLRTPGAFIVRDVALSADRRLALENLIDARARIVFVDSNSSVALSVLCAARELEMTPDAGFVWILREWSGVNATCAGELLTWNLFTISFWWRGGKVPFRLNGTSVRDALDAAPWAAWPLRAAPLADALIILLRGIENFLQTNPQRQYDLHGGNATRLFWENFDENGVDGVTQTYNWDAHGITDPLIFVDKWQGNRRDPLAIWRVDKDEIVELYSQGHVFSDRIPSDGARFCMAKSDNDSFSPYCYDDMCVAALCAGALALPALALARRVQRRRLERRRLALTARLLRLGGALEDLLVDRAALHLRVEIGAGRFGVVRAAVLRTADRAIDVAAKALRDESTPAEEREFLNEAVILAPLRHERVVRLVGVCVGGGPPLVLMERAFFGDLLRYLQRRRRLLGVGEASCEAAHVSPAALTRLARQAAAALEYLGERGVVHRDVRAANCLVTSSRSLKLADFGLARRTAAGGEYVSRRRGPLPVPWMAPESLECGAFSAASDAWGLGVLLLELVTLGARPYGAWSPQRVLGHVAAGGKPPLPRDASPGTRRVLAGCWRRAPHERTTAAALGAFLDANPELLRPALEPALETEADDSPAGGTVAVG